MPAFSHFFLKRLSARSKFSSSWIITSDKICFPPRWRFRRRLWIDSKVRRHTRLRQVSLERFRRCVGGGPVSGGLAYGAAVRGKRKLQTQNYLLCVVVARNRLRVFAQRHGTSHPQLLPTTGSSEFAVSVPCPHCAAARLHAANERTKPPHGYPGGQVMGRPPSRWRWRCFTVWPPSL
jgi:hypothetical protein